MKGDFDMFYRPVDISYISAEPKSFYFVSAVLCFIFALIFLVLFFESGDKK